jgi:hypothetical protein
MTPPTDPTGDSLARQFRTILSAGIHPAGCLCGGGLFAPQLTAANLEEDVLDYLEPRYDGALRTLLETRRETRTIAFPDWLRKLDSAEIGEPDRQRIKTDLKTIFDSFSEVTNPASRFVCD